MLPDLESTAEAVAGTAAVAASKTQKTYSGAVPLRPAGLVRSRQIEPSACDSINEADRAR